MAVRSTLLSLMAMLPLVCQVAAGWSAEPVESVWRCTLPPGSERPSVEIPYQLRAIQPGEGPLTQDVVFPLRAWSFTDLVLGDENGRQVARRLPMLCWFDAEGSIERVRQFPGAAWAWVSRDGTTVLYMNDVVIDGRFATGSCTASIHCESAEGDAYWERESDCAGGALSADGDLAIIAGARTTELRDRRGDLVASLRGEVSVEESVLPPSGGRLLLILRKRLAPPGLDRTTTAVCLTTSGDSLWSMPIGRTVSGSAAFAAGSEKVFLGYCMDRRTPRERKDPLPVVVCVSSCGDELARIQFEDRPSNKIWLDYDHDADELVVGLSRSAPWAERVRGVVNDVLRLAGDDLSITLDLALRQPASMHGVAAGPAQRVAVALLFGDEQRGEVVVYDQSQVLKRVSTSPRLSGLARTASPPLIVAGSGQYWAAAGPGGFVQLIPWD
jgi:hypothetical protein